MGSGRCPLHCGTHYRCTRRDFLWGSAGLLAGSVLLDSCSSIMTAEKVAENPIKAYGPASQYVPTIKAAFVRRKGDYGMRWPGAVYNGEAAKHKYTAQLTDAAKTLGVKLDLRAEPIYSPAEADAWLAEAKDAKADGLVVLVLDRQEHAWPKQPPRRLAPASRQLSFHPSAPPLPPIPRAWQTNPAASSTPRTTSARPYMA